MSKNPDFAECKTRLKSLLSREERTYIAKYMLDITCSVVSQFDTVNILHLFPNKDGMFIKNLLKKYNITPQVQKAGMLSDKIYSILDQDNQIFKKKLVIGADIPSISINEISDCINLLNEYDCILGPSNDEGFYLVGTKANAHFIFENLNMDTILLEDLTDICKKNSISYKLIRELKDIDCEKDLLFI